MKSTKHWIAGLALATMTSTAAAAWDVHDEGFAMQWMDTGMAVAIAFFPEERCEAAHIAVMGNGDIRAMGLLVDAVDLGQSGVEIRDNTIALVELTKHGVQALKDGRTAFIVTDQGSLHLDLNGSRDAIDAAQAACFKTIVRPLTPNVRPKGVTF